MRYRYQILGTTRVLRSDGTTVPLGGARLRSLLTALALSPGRDVRSETLIAAVWADGEPPHDAPGALQALVGRLRRALGRERVASAAGGYRLVAEPEEVDASRFETLADAGSRALLSGDATGAVAQLDEALDLWQGRAFADLPDSGGAASVRAEARRLEASRTRAEARLVLGQADAVLVDLAALCAEHPLDEPLQALRLRALRDAGRPAEALAAYESVRTELAELLGADPGPELRALHAQLLTQAVPHTMPVAAQDGSRASHSAPPGQAGQGGTHTALAGRSAVTRASRGNLPARLTSFVGREEEMGALKRELAAFRLVTLLGPGGAGKTRLSQEAADALSGQWQDGVWLAELASVRDGGTVPEAVLTALGGRETVVRAAGADSLRAVAAPGARDPLVELAELCVGRRMLLLLDNCEHVVDAAARLAERLLVQCPGVTVLATSREPLGVAGESVLVVDPLPRDTALELLRERGAASRKGFRTQEDPRAAAEICERLDGLPLALELAAARLRSLTLRQIADRLDDRFRLLTNGSRTALPRQQTLRAVVDWSWELLDGDERAVLRRLSVCSGGCELEQAEAICSGPGLAALEVTARLSSLVDKSLVVATARGGRRMRYRLLETVAEYAAERLDEAGEREATEQRHLAAYREVARSSHALLRGPRQGQQLDRLEREHDNIRAALHRAVTAGAEHEALSLALSMAWFWQLRNHRADARHWCRLVAALGPDPFQGPVSVAPPLKERCTDQPPPLPTPLLWEARRQVRVISLMLADQEEPHTHAAARTLRAFIDSYHPQLPQLCHTVCTSWYYARLVAGDLAGLRQDLDLTVARCRELGYEWELAAALRLRSRLNSGQREEATYPNQGAHPDQGALAGQVTDAADADESLAIFRRLRDGWGVAEALSSRSQIRESRGDLEGAAQDLREGVAIAGDLNDQAQAQLFRTRLGGLLVETGQPAEGERTLRQALAEGERLGSDALVLTRVYLATLLGRTDRTEECRRHLDTLLAEFAGRQEPQQLVRGMVDGLYGWLELLAGHPELSRSRLLQAVRHPRHPLAQLIAPELSRVVLLYAAETVVALGRAEDAARLLGAFDALHSARLRLSLQHQECRARAETAVRAALGEDGAYARAYAAGGALTLDQATALI